MQRERIIGAIAAAVLLAALGAQGATTNTWLPNGGSTSSWNTAGNWSPATVPNAADDVALLTTPLLNNVWITLDAAITLGRLELKNPWYNYYYTIRSPGSLRFEASGSKTQIVCFGAVNFSDSAFAMDISADIAFATNMVIATEVPNWYRFNAAKMNGLKLGGVLSGNYPLWKTGPGMLLITNALNSFSGTVTVEQGWLAATNNGSLGDAANTLTLGSKGHLGHLVMLSSSSGSRSIQLAGEGGALHWMSSAGVIGGTGTLVLGPGNRVYLSNATDNTYSGEAYVLGWAQAQTAAKVFPGDVNVQFPGYLQLTNAANVAAGAKAHLEGFASPSPPMVFPATLRLNNDFMPDIDTNSTRFLVEFTNSGPNICARLAAGAATLGNGYFYLGRFGYEIVTNLFTGDSLQPNADGVYRFLGADYNSYLRLNHPDSTVGVLTGTNAVEVQTMPGTRGYSGIDLGDDVNDFTGTLTIGPGACVQGTNQPGGSSFGDANGPVAIRSGSFKLYAMQTAGGQPVTKGATVFDGNANIYLFGAFSGQARLTLKSLDRENRGTLYVQGQYGIGKIEEDRHERLLVTDNPPAVSNGIVAPYMFAPTNFLFYNATYGFTNAPFTRTGLTGAVPTDIVNVSTPESVPDGGVVVYALRATTNLSANTTVPADAITIGSGGLLLNGDGTNTAPINFGSSEGIVIVRSSTTWLFGPLAGTNGLTIGAPADGLARRFYLYGNNSSLTGRITINKGYVTITNATGFGSADNTIYMNGRPGFAGDYAVIAPNLAAGVTLANTIELGPNGGAFFTSSGAGTLTLSGYMTGSGGLTVGGHVGTPVYINNSSNDYAGGTLIAMSGKVTVGANGRLGAGPVIVGDWRGAYLGVLELLGSSNLAPGATLTVLRSYDLANNDGDCWVKFQATSAMIGALQGSGNVELGTDAVQCTLTTGVNNASTEFFGNITDYLRAGYAHRTNALVKAGTGTFTLWGEGLYRGATTVRAGTMLVHGCISGTAVVDGATAVLGGNGLVNDVVVTNAATLAADTLSAQSVTLYPGCHFAVTLNGAVAGAQAQTNYDQLLARSGTLTLGNSTLDIALGYAPAADTTFTIIKNESGNPVSGTFAGLPEGATVSAPYNGRVYVFRIRYNVGTGKDVVLQAVPTGTVFKFCMIAHPRRA